MVVVMEKELRDLILAQHKEADEFNKVPGNWMGKLPDPFDFEYWNNYVPSGTLKEYKRIQLVEDAYYTTCELVSKSVARSKDFANWTDEKIIRYMENLGVRYD